jgi:hypothetical protein
MLTASPSEGTTAAAACSLQPRGTDMAFRFGASPMDDGPQRTSEDDVQTIVEAGFPREAAEVALADCGGDVEAALEMLLAEGPDGMPPELGESPVAMLPLLSRKGRPHHISACRCGATTQRRRLPPPAERAQEMFMRPGLLQAVLDTFGGKSVDELVGIGLSREHAEVLHSQLTANSSDGGAAPAGNGDSPAGPPPLPTARDEAGGGAEDQEGFAHKVGALGAGNDLDKRQCTVAEAMAHAKALRGCLGFTFSGAHPNALGESVQVFFKSSADGNDDPEWQTYLKEDPEQEEPEQEQQQQQ